MPRPRRNTSPAIVHHVYNRGNQKQPVFSDHADFDEFLSLMLRARERVPIRIVAFCLMWTHWHLVLWPYERHSISCYIHWLATVHSLRFRARTHTKGLGHVYQDRFKTRPVRTQTDYIRLVRYVEGNPLVAGHVTRAEDWRWSSLAARCRNDATLVDAGPIALPLDWVNYVNQILQPVAGTDPPFEMW